MYNRGGKERTDRTESNHCAVVSSELCVRILVYICMYLLLLSQAAGKASCTSDLERRRE